MGYFKKGIPAYACWIKKNLYCFLGIRGVPYKWGICIRVQNYMGNDLTQSPDTIKNLNSTTSKFFPTHHGWFVFPHWIWRLPEVIKYTDRYIREVKSPRWRKFWTRDVTSSCVMWRHEFNIKFRRSKQTWKQSFWGLPLTCGHDVTFGCSRSGKRLSKPPYYPPYTLNAPGNSQVTYFHDWDLSTRVYIRWFHWYHISFGRLVLTQWFSTW